MAGWPPGHCQVGADSRVILAGLQAQYTRVPREDGVRWNTSAAPPQAFQTAVAEAFAPDNPCGFSLPHPAWHVQAALCHATPCCEPLGWGCRGAPGARAEGCARGGRQRGALRAPEGMLPRRQGKKSTRRVFAAAPGVCPWRAVSALCRRRGQPLPQALPQLPQLRCVHLHNTLGPALPRRAPPQAQVARERQQLPGLQGGELRHHCFQRERVQGGAPSPLAGHRACRDKAASTSWAMPGATP